MSKMNKRGTAWSRSVRVVGAYLVAGVLWILLSDTLVEQLVSDPAALTRLQSWKGWGFVFVTAGVLHLVLLQQFRRDRKQLDRNRAQQEEILRLSQFQQTIINNANVWLNVSDPEGYIMLWNRAAERISGYSEEEVAGSRAIWRKLYPDPDYRARVTAQVQEALSQGQEVMGLETRIQTRWGGERLIAWNARGFTDSHGSLAGSIVIGTDITERKAVEDALRERERQLATLMDSLPGMAYRCLYNEFWTMKFVSSGCWELTGYRPEELIENRRVAWSELVVPDDSGDVLSKVEEAIANGVSFSLEYRLRRADGEVIWVWERGRGGEDDDGMLLEGIILDITERKRLEERLSELATLDSLTGQLNRREAERMLQEEVVRAGRYDRQLAVLWVDLDHFKEVNDTWGHAAGDRVLRAVSLRLADSIRTVDTLGRYGGEEFLVVIPEASVDEARETAERLRQRVAEEPVTITGDQSLSMTISIGVAVYPDHGTSAEELCNRADKAMYLAKERGRNQVAIFNELPGRQSSG